jgi:putative transposase
LEKFGPDYARNIHPKKLSRNDVWHLDEVVVTIVGKRHWLRHVVDHDGYVLDKIVGTAATPRQPWIPDSFSEEARHRAEADDHRQGALRWCGARRQVMPDVESGPHENLNNHAANSHVPLRKR